MRRPVLVTLVVAVAVLAAALGLYFYLLANRGETDSAYPSQPENGAHFDEAVVHGGLSTRTASSDLVLKGTVLGAAPGGTHVFPEDEGGSKLIASSRLRVDRVL